jgi:hypothetical protein
MSGITEHHILLMKGIFTAFELQQTLNQFRWCLFHFVARTLSSTNAEASLTATRSQEIISEFEQKMMQVVQSPGL